MGTSSRASRPRAAVGAVFIRLLSPLVNQGFTPPPPPPPPPPPLFSFFSIRSPESGPQIRSSCPQCESGSFSAILFPSPAADHTYRTHVHARAHVEVSLYLANRLIMTPIHYWDSGGCCFPRARLGKPSSVFSSGPRVHVRAPGCIPVLFEREHWAFEVEHRSNFSSLSTY